MNVVVVALTFGAALVHQESLPGVRVTGIDPLSGHTYVNFRRVDVNDDHATDLVLPDRVLLGKPNATPVAFEVVPTEIPGPGIADFFHETLFVRTAEGIAEYRWGEDAWTMMGSQPIAWPDTDSIHEPDERADSSPVLSDFGEFLYDVDADGVPEMAVVTFRAVHIYSRANGAFEETAKIDVPVASRLLVTTTPLRRVGDSPGSEPLALGYSFDVILRDTGLRFLTQEPLGPNTQRFATTTHEDWESLASSPHAIVETDPVPTYMRPCDLDDHGPIDLAGTTAYRVSNTLLPTTVTVTTASLDGGKTLQHFRTRGFRPKCSFVDVDGDGHRELITEETALFAGGPKQATAQLLTAREIPHTISVHRLEDGAYTREPVLNKRVAIRLDRPPIEFSPMLARYRSGDVVDVTGDYDGDGHRDLLVRVATDEIHVYLKRGSGFSTSPDAATSVLPQHEVHAADIDGDGVSEILLQYLQGDLGSESETVAVWLRWN